MGSELRDRRRLTDRARSEEEPAVALIGPTVADSWKRCSGVPVDSPARLTEADVGASWRASPVRRAAGDVLDRLGQVAISEDYVAAVLDQQGTIVWSAAGRQMSKRAERAHFVLGTNWSEPSAGTNAPGLTLATGGEAVVFASEHWCEPVHDWVCYSAPLRTHTGRLIGVLDLSSTWNRASPLAAATVASMAQLIGHQLHDVDVGGPHLSIDVLGTPTVHVDGRALRCSPRQIEILLVLAMRGTASLDELHDAIHRDRQVSTTTVKAEVSHLRRLLDGAISSRPYRLTLDVTVDVVGVLDAVRLGDIDRATTLYCAELLPMSESPFIVDTRRHLDVAVRTAVLAHGTAEHLLRFARVHPFDTEVLDCVGSRCAPGSPAAAEAAARIAAATTH